MAEQDHRQPAQGKILRHVVARFARHDNVRTRGDGGLSKVAQGTAQNSDGSACVLGFAPHTRVAAEGCGSTGGKITQRARVVERCKRAQAGDLGVVHVLQ